MTAAVLPEITVGRRAFPVTQELFFGVPDGAAQTLRVGWYDSSVHPETGAFALVSTDAMAINSALEELIGEIVVVSFATLRVFACVLQDATLPAGTDLALYRRAYAALSRLNRNPITASVAAVS